MPGRGGAGEVVEAAAAGRAAVAPAARPDLVPAVTGDLGTAAARAADALGPAVPPGRLAAPRVIDRRGQVHRGRHRRWRRRWDSSSTARRASRRPRPGHPQTRQKPRRNRFWLPATWRAGRRPAALLGRFPPRGLGVAALGFLPRPACRPVRALSTADQKAVDGLWTPPACRLRRGVPRVLPPPVPVARGPLHAPRRLRPPPGALGLLAAVQHGPPRRPAEGLPRPGDAGGRGDGRRQPVRRDAVLRRRQEGGRAADRGRADARGPARGRDAPRRPAAGARARRPAGQGRDRLRQPAAPDVRGLGRGRGGEGRPGHARAAGPAQRGPDPADRRPLRAGGRGPAARRQGRGGAPAARPARRPTATGSTSS